MRRDLPPLSGAVAATTAPRCLRLLNVIRTVNPASGGMAEGLRQSVAATRALGHVEEVLTLDAADDAWVANFPAPIHAIGPATGLYGHTPHLVPWLHAHAAGYDAVIVHGLWQYHSLAVRRALQGSRTPYFIYPHGMLDPWFKRRYPLKHLKKWLYWPWGEYPVLRAAAAVLFTAQEEARLAAQSFWLYRARTAVVGYGVALDDASRRSSAEAFARAWPQTRGKRLLLFMARLNPKKGGDLLIEALARVASGDESLHLVMAGPDDGSGARASWHALAERLGVAQRITWTGMLAGTDKWSAFRAADAFVLPSHQENFGIAVVEALAMGVPVLLSDKVNIWREIVDDGAGLAGSDSVEGTVETLRRWLSLSATERVVIRDQAGACFQRHFHMSSAARRLIETIDPFVSRLA